MYIYIYIIGVRSVSLLGMPSSPQTRRGRGLYLPQSELPQTPDPLNNLIHFGGARAISSTGRFWCGGIL